MVVRRNLSILVSERRAAAKFFDSGPAGDHSRVAGRASWRPRSAREAPKFRACGAPGAIGIILLLTVTAQPFDDRNINVQLFSGQRFSVHEGSPYNYGNQNRSRSNYAVGTVKIAL